MIETRTNAYQVRRGEYPEEQISVYFTVRQYGSLEPGSRSSRRSTRCGSRCDELIEELVIEPILRPLAQAIATR